MGEMWVTMFVGLLKTVTFVYDVVSFIPSYLLYQPHQRLKQSNRLKAKSIKNEASGPYRAMSHIQELTTTLDPECVTLDQLFKRAVMMNGGRQALGTREVLREEDEMQPNGRVFKKLILGDYSWDTYEEVNKKVSVLGSGLLALGQRPQSNIMIFAETRAEWMIAAQACFKYNFPVVTLYATLGEEAIIHGANESQVTHIITSNDLLPKFKKILNRMPLVKHLVFMDGGKRPDLAGFPDDVFVHSMTNVMQEGAKPENLATPITHPTPDNLAVIMYTSGSTGLPKGVLITHGNLMAGISGQCERIPELGEHDDCYIGYLPLAHVLELSAEVACLSNGVKIGYSTPLTLSDQSSKIKKGSKGDASMLQPTLMAAVPVIMDRLYKAVWEKVNDGGPITKALFTFAYEYKLRCMERGYDTPIFNHVVFKKIRKLLGGNVRLMLSGGAPLSADTQRFMNVCFCCPVGQGYGLTETCGAGTITEATDFSTGRVGAPLVCNEIRLIDWPEGNYLSSDKPFPRGEVLLGGANITMGYYRNEKKTKEDFHMYGNTRYFLTGDIGQIESDGSLRIIDRKKDLVKLQAGEYVSLGKVETVLKMTPTVDNICVYADSLKMYTVALVVPNQKQVRILAEKIGIDTNDWQRACENKDIIKEVMKSIQEQGKKGKLERFEIPAKIALASEIWTPETGLVTDAFKLKRKNLQAHYQDEISRMYA